MKKIIYFFLFILLMSFNPIKENNYNSTYIVKDSLNTKFLLISDSIYIDSLELKLDGDGVIRFYCNSAGSTGIGTSSPSASAKLDVSSTTQGVLLPILKYKHDKSILYSIVWTARIGHLQITKL